MCSIMKYARLKLKVEVRLEIDSLTLNLAHKYKRKYLIIDSAKMELQHMP